ncbi:serine/threonine protein kinase [Streptomyces sp. NBC_00006]|uniref:serine/threonine-protein kinase n=1 Tax=unclassified Streptomyces TaxID=2593676 RepID=UPI00224CBA21|nr:MULTISPECIES: serine/threonine-protein kinase [unclassified Streptomyces]MCX5536885.1 serine/threonine protein kinase [Streptomyces sp. NBC_00006]
MGDERASGAGHGRVIAGRYRVVGRLGSGGMGTVWRAVDERLGREVAVKELRSFDGADGPDPTEQRLRMEREARAAARVRHHGVVAVHDVVEHEGRPVIVMELVDGESLQGLLQRRGPLDPVEAARIGAEVSDALAAAHRAGVWHRDVKPSNILLEHGGRVVLTDFGIAALQEPDDGAATRITRSGELVGSLDYLAPEQARGGDVGPATDVWALGASLYSAVEGAPPFRRTSTWSTITAIVTEPLPEPRRAGPLAPALAELLDKDPALRADAVRAAQLLRATAAGEPLPPRSPDTMRLRRPEVGTETQAEQQVPRPGPHAFAAGASPMAAPPRHPGPAGAETVSAQRGDTRRRGTVAVAVAAALLVGAGATYLVTSQGDDEGSGSAAGTVAADRSKSPTPPSHSPSDPPSGTPSATPPATVTPSASTSAAPSVSASATPSPACTHIGGGRSNCRVWRSATSYDSQHRPVGTIRPGTNYFYCQAKRPQRETHGEWTNVWWAKTDDDSGNSGVFVSDVYLTGGKNDQPVPGLAVC